MFLWLHWHTLYLLSVYDQACHITSSNHVHSPNILSKDTENHHVIRTKPSLLFAICFRQNLLHSQHHLL